MKKSVLATVVSLFITVASLPLVNCQVQDRAMTVSAANNNKYTEYKSGGITYYVYSDYACIEGCLIDANGNNGKIVIPSKVKGVPVTSIHNNAFGYCKNLKSIVVPDTVEYISGEAFRSCENLETVTLGKNVKEMAEYVFAFCPSLQEVTIPDSVTNISINTFYDCKSLKKVVWGKGLTEIPYGTFQGCSSLTDVTIRGKVTTIEDNAFEGAGLTRFALPDTVTECGGAAFMDCTKLKSIDLGNKITAINYCTFCGCSSLESIDIPDSVKCIDERAFALCSKIKSVELGKHVTYIGKGAFESCTSLESATVLNSKCEIISDPQIFNGVNYDLTFYDSKKVVLSGREGSTLERYALKNGYSYYSVPNQDIGDVNSDGYIDSVDASEILKVYADISTGGKAPRIDIFDVYDVNKDKMIDSLDASKILEYYAYVSADKSGSAVSFETYIAK